MHLLSAWLPILLAAHCQSADTSPTLELPPSSAVPGGIVVLDLDAASDSAPRVVYRDNPVMVVRHDKIFMERSGEQLPSAFGRRAAYLWCARGILESPVAVRFLKASKEAATTRNWATILKLHALAGTPP